MGQIKRLPNKDFVPFARTMINAFPGFPGYGTPDKATIDKLSKSLRETDKMDSWPISFVKSATRYSLNSQLSLMGSSINKIFLSDVKPITTTQF